MPRQDSISEQVCEQVDRVDRLLGEHYGRPRLEQTGDATGELVRTILSQHTTDVSSGKAYDALIRRYPSWSDVRAASPAEIAESIRFAGLATQKAKTIHRALVDTADGSLGDLGELPVPLARSRLTSIPGVGDKTASCVLLFALGMPAQPVDTHIMRVSKRLGVATDRTDASGIQDLYEHCLPADGQAMYAFHVTMVRHGREVCQARAPRCERCVLAGECSYYSRETRIG